MNRNDTFDKDALAKQMDNLAGQRWAILYEHDDLFRQVAAALRSGGPEREGSQSAGADDTRRMDWLEDIAKVYWVTVQTQPHGEHIFAGQGKALREAIDDDMAKRFATEGVVKE